jgi:hypothetical protein
MQGCEILSAIKYTFIEKKTFSKYN